MILMITDHRIENMNIYKKFKKNNWKLNLCKLTINDFYEL